MNDCRPPKPRLRWYQFSVRTLLIVVLVLGVFFGWLGSRLQRAARHRQMAAELHGVKAEVESLGGRIYAYTDRPPNWLDKLLGDPGVFDVQTVTMGQAADADLKHLKDLSGVFHSWELDLTDTPITDAGLDHLKKLTGLQSVNLHGTKVTGVGATRLKDALPNVSITPSPECLVARDEITEMGDGGWAVCEAIVHYRGALVVYLHFAGDSEKINAVLGYVSGLTNLKEPMELDLLESQLEDAHLEHVGGLTNLRRLSLIRTPVTNAGLEHLRALSGLRWLDLSGTQITDAGLVHLKGLSELRTLDLGMTQIGDAGLEHLKEPMNLCSLGLMNTQVTDEGLKHMERLMNLVSVNVRGTHVTAEGVKKLQQALPNCKIKH